MQEVITHISDQKRITAAQPPLKTPPTPLGWLPPFLVYLSDEPSSSGPTEAHNHRRPIIVRCHRDPPQVFKGRYRLDRPPVILKDPCRALTRLLCRQLIYLLIRPIGTLGSGAAHSGPSMAQTCCTGVTGGGGGFPPPVLDVFRTKTGCSLSFSGM